MSFRALEKMSLRAMESDSEAETELISTPKLPLFSASHIQSTEPSGYLTPPFYTTVSVPFGWEEEPGKPRPCTDLATIPEPVDFSQKCLELPPRLLLEAKLLSPTTVLEGPYVGRSKFQTYSFRKVTSECYGSSSSPDHETSEHLGALILSKRGVKEKGWFDSLGRRVLKGKREVAGANYVFPSSVDGESDGGGSVGDSTSMKVNYTRHRRARSFSSITQSMPPFWATIYQGLKQVVPWKSRKLKRGGSMI